MVTDLQGLIEAARWQATQAVNVGLTMLYWRIGKRVRDEVLASQRASYGEEIVATLSRQLVADYGRGFEAKNLHRMLQFAETFPDEATLRRWASSCARARSRSRSRCWSWTRPASMSLTT